MFQHPLLIQRLGLTVFLTTEIQHYPNTICVSINSTNEIISLLIIPLINNLLHTCFLFFHRSQVKVRVFFAWMQNTLIRARIESKQTLLDKANLRIMAIRVYNGVENMCNSRDLNVGRTMLQLQKA
jgi:hypothetical protein